MKREKYQILMKGIYTNKLVLEEVDTIREFEKIVDDFKKGRYENLILLETNIYEKLNH